MPAAFTGTGTGTGSPTWSLSGQAIGERATRQGFPASSDAVDAVAQAFRRQVPGESPAP